MVTKTKRQSGEKGKRRRLKVLNLNKEIVKTSFRFPSLSSASAFMPSLSSANRSRACCAWRLALGLTEPFKAGSTV